MIFLYSVFILFYSWNTAIKYYKSNKKGLLVNQLSKKEEQDLFFIVFLVFLGMLFLTGYQSYDFFTSIFSSDIESIVDIPMEFEEYAVFGNIGLSLLKIFWIPAKITKYILQVLFGTLSVFVFYSNHCLKKLIKFPKYLRNILYSLCVLDVVYILVAIF